MAGFPSSDAPLCALDWSSLFQFAATSRKGWWTTAEIILMSRVYRKPTPSELLLMIATTERDGGSPPAWLLLGCPGWNARISAPPGFTLSDALFRVVLATETLRPRQHEALLATDAAINAADDAILATERVLSGN